MSTLPYDSKEFKQGLTWQWNTLDLCAGQKVNRSNPDFLPFMKWETQVGKKRACWNSWIAPYNFEGFFFNMGDMLVKNGEWEKAIIVYHNATLARNYPTWPYRHLLEERIANAKNNVGIFQTSSVQNISSQRSERDQHTPRILFNSGIGCAVCHQEG